MTRKEALNFMESSGMSKEQIHAIVGALEQDSEKRYTRLFDALKFNWCINCEHDDKLTDKIERCEATLTTLHNLGFNLVNGEVENV
jgi:hypothetical protein